MNHDSGDVGRRVFAEGGPRPNDYHFPQAASAFDEAKRAQTPFMGGGNGVGFGHTLAWCLFAACGLPAVPLALVGVPVLLLCCVALRRLGSDGAPRIGLWQAYLGAFFVIHAHVVAGMLCYVLANAAPGFLSINVLLISQLLAMLVGAKLLRERLGIAGRGFLNYVASCATVVVILLVTIAASASAVVVAFDLPLELSTFR